MLEGGRSHRYCRGDLVRLGKSLSDKELEHLFLGHGNFLVNHLVEVLFGGGAEVVLEVSPNHIVGKIVSQFHQMPIGGLVSPNLQSLNVYFLNIGVTADSAVSGRLLHMNSPVNIWYPGRADASSMCLGHRLRVMALFSSDRAERVTFLTSVESQEAERTLSIWHF